MHSTTLPLVICIGAPKSGTSTLYDLMATHPNVSVTRFKESDYLLDSTLYLRGYDNYLRTEFMNNPDAMALFEADPLYIYSDSVLTRLCAWDPQCRIVIMLRNPIDRAFSEYLAVIRYADDVLPFRDVCVQWLSSEDKSLPVYQVIERSFYTARIRKVLELFPREQIHFILFDDFVSFTYDQIRALECWLGIGHMRVEETHSNPAAENRSWLVAKLLSNPRYSGLRSTVRALIPGRVLRRALSRYIFLLNSRPYAPAGKPQLKVSELPTALLAMYRDDLLELESLVDLDLGVWIDRLSSAVGPPPSLSDLTT